jgi:hypothetical protein
MSRVFKLAFALVGACVLALIAWRWLRKPVETAPPMSAPLKPTPAAPSALVDPLLPGRSAQLDETRAAVDPNWAMAPPSPKFQYSRSAAQRGGVEPCAAPSPAAANGASPLSRGYLFPGDKALDADGNFDLIFHLNGEGPVRRELVESGQPFALYTLTLPPTESYAPLFAGSGLFGQLVAEIERTIAKKAGVNARARHVALSAWSAGFEGVRSILYQPEAKRVEAVLLIDGLHAPRKQTGLTDHLQPFIGFARRAQRGETWFVITHSSIPTIDYTSSTESAHFLIHELGGRPSAVKRDDGFGLELVDFFSSGNLNVRGYAGNDKPDHCAQLFLLRSLFVALHRHFNSQAIATPPPLDAGPEPPETPPATTAP